MKAAVSVLPFIFVLASCDKESTAETPKAVEVNEEVTVVVPAPTAEAIEDAAEEAEEMAEDAAAALDPNRPQTPGEHLDHALQKTGEGLQTAGEKTEEGLKTAKEKTEAGLEKAAEKTGEFIKRVGERIEEQAEPE